MRLVIQINWRQSLNRGSPPEVFFKKGILRNFAKFTEKLLCQRLFFNKVTSLRPATLLKKESLAQVFSCEFCDISKNIFSLQNTSGGCFNLKNLCRIFNFIFSLFIFCAYSQVEQIMSNIFSTAQLTFIWSKSIVKTLEKDVKETLFKRDSNTGILLWV